jgi:hypothetical protein
MSCGVPSIGRVDHDGLRIGTLRRQPLHHTAGNIYFAPALSGIVERPVCASALYPSRHRSPSINENDAAQDS